MSQICTTEKTFLEGLFMTFLPTHLHAQKTRFRQKNSIAIRLHYSLRSESKSNNIYDNDKWSGYTH